MTRRAAGQAGLAPWQKPPTTQLSAGHAGARAWRRRVAGLGAAAALLAGCGPTGAAQGPASAPPASPVSEVPIVEASPDTTSTLGATPTAANTALPIVTVTPTTPTPERPAGGQRSAPASPAAPSPAAPASGNGPLAGKTIVIDPGHNGGASAAFNNRQVPAGNGRTKACNTSGTAIPGGMSEHVLNLRLAQVFAGRLKQASARVAMTRTTDSGAGRCVNDRAAVGNRAKADAAVSLHADGNEKSGARGFHVIRSTTMVGGPGIEAESEALAQSLVEAFEATGMPRSNYLGGGTGITPRSDIAGLNLSQVPAVMLEAGNMHNSPDARLLTDPAFVEAEAKALVAALEGWIVAR